MEPPARRRSVEEAVVERFTERARQVVVLAQDEARALKHNYIGTEHILLGLLRDVERLEHACRETFLLAEQSQQDVLGADVVVLQRPRLILGKDDDLTSPLGESLKQPSMPPSTTSLLNGRGCRPQIEGRAIVAQ